MQKSLFILLSVLLISGCYGQTLSVSEQASDIIKTAGKYHCAPPQIDNEFSETVFNEFISLLDPAGIIFSSEEIAELEGLKYDIDDEILNNNCLIVEKTHSLYEKRLHYINSLLDVFNSDIFDFKTDDSLTFAENQVFVTSSEFDNRWKNLIKARILTAILSNSDSINIPHPDIEKINETKGRIISSEKCRIRLKLGQSDDSGKNIGSLFLKAVSFAFDPHTEYYTPFEENSFENTMSRDALAFGFNVFRNEMGEIEIYSIDPGSPAWKSNMLNEGDVILEMEAEGLYREFDCLELSEVLQYINSKDINKAEFVVRKKNEKKIRVSLQKEKINVEENIVRSFILEDKSKIGYIYLPSFYSQIEGLVITSTGCANDIAKEILKLKNEGIEGLIFDLRDNGGGSILEAIELSGIFIDFGALVILHERDQLPVTVKDLNRGVLFNEPLVVLVNSFSASASELFAASMQDYNRGLIVGSKTFGKSTSQIIIPADAYKYDLNNLKETNYNGYLKLTTGRFYRITGKSHQKTGILPDITLPCIYDQIEVGEAAFETALDPDFTDKKAYYTPLDTFPVNELRYLSENRIKSDSSFREIERIRDWLPMQKGNFMIPLKFEKFIDFCEKTDYLFLDKDSCVDVKLNSAFLVKNPEYLKGVSNINDSLTEFNGNIMDQIRNDLYINEAYFIINDLINIKNNRK